MSIQQIKNQLKYELTINVNEHKIQQLYNKYLFLKKQSKQIGGKLPILCPRKIKKLLNELLTIKNDGSERTNNFLIKLDQHSKYIEDICYRLLTPHLNKLDELYGNDLQKIGKYAQKIIKCQNVNDKQALFIIFLKELETVPLFVKYYYLYNELENIPTNSIYSKNDVNKNNNIIYIIEFYLNELYYDEKLATVLHIVGLKNLFDRLTNSLTNMKQNLIFGNTQNIQITLPDIIKIHGYSAKIFENSAYQIYNLYKTQNIGQAEIQTNEKDIYDILISVLNQIGNIYNLLISGFFTDTQLIPITDRKQNKTISIDTFNELIKRNADNINNFENYDKLINEQIENFKKNNGICMM